MNFPFRLACWLTLGCSSAAGAPAGISTDGSVGARGSVPLTGSTFVIPASLGTQSGGNLFHSFSEFNLLQGQTADFTGTGATGAIHNVIARVTGGDPSSIDGTIQCDITGANFYLLNPSGVMFGAHAQVDVKGAFTVGTANVVNFADGTGRFNTSLGGNDVLTSADVSAFGFLGTAPQPVQFTQSNLALAAGSRFAVVGGDISLDGATLASSGGDFALVSVKGNGLVNFDGNGPTGITTVTRFGTITLQNGAGIAIGGAQGGGNVVIRGGKMVMQNGANITAYNSGNNAGGGIDIHVDSLSADDSSISTATNGGASAGATAGPVTVTVAQALQLTGGGTISSTTSSAGDAGNVSVSAGSLTIDGLIGSTPDIAHFTGITSDCTPNSSGAGGSLTLNITGAIAISAGGSITADTEGAGNAGSVTVTHADSLSIDGTQAILYGELTGENPIFTGISSTTATGMNEPPGTGNGGTINLTITHDIDITAFGQIEASTYTSGAAGEITIGARSMVLNGRFDANVLTGITSNSEMGSTNNGGTIRVTLTGGLTCTGGAGINSQAFASGNGGNVAVSAGGVISLSDSGYISSDTYSSGNGGTVTVSASSININGAGPDIFDPPMMIYPTGITSVSDSNPLDSGAVPTGNGGTVNVTASHSLQLLNGGLISATAKLADAGNVTIKVGQDLNLTDRAGIFTSAGENGGVIHISAGNELFMFDSEIKSEANGTSDDAGDITIDPVFVSLDDSRISANAPHGHGGNILILTDNFLESNAAITATGTTNGTITITSPNLDLGGKLASLPNVPVDDGQKLRESCARSIQHEFSTLVVEGRGGTENGPEELLPDFGSSSGRPLPAASRVLTP
jgi:filamentous hemagglutinin family protein